MCKYTAYFLALSVRSVEANHEMTKTHLNIILGL
jgi:hypothetical protein